MKIYMNMAHILLSMPHLREILSTEMKVVLHLSKYSHVKDLYVIPRATTQQGIADSIHVSRNYISVLLSKLVRRGWVNEQTSHVVGSPKKKKSYFLTETGKRQAANLRRTALESLVSLRTEDGLVDVKCADLGRYITPPPDMVDVMRMLGRDGVLDLAHAVNLTCPEEGTQTVRPPHPTLPRGGAIRSGFLGTKKICLLGDAGVGKTSIIRRYVYSTFDEAYVSTIGTKVSTKVLHVDEGGKRVIIKLLIWDLMGNPRFRRVRESALRGAKGAVVVCDVSRGETQENVEEWAASIYESVGDIPWIILANKSDLVPPGGAGWEDVRARAERYGVPYYFTSAKTGENVNDAFHMLASMIIMSEDVSILGDRSVALNRPIEALDEIIDLYCSRHGGQEVAMHEVRSAVSRSGLDLESPARADLIRFVDHLVDPEKRDTSFDPEEEKKIYIGIIDRYLEMRPGG